jgi:mono/diheme cytochrome c family protein
MSCASCHFDGDHDGRTWMFENGPRNTTSLRGTRDTRPLHWSADRDEVQDFEHTIKTLQFGDGLLAGGEPNPSLGAPNAGRSADLDALAAFVNTLRHRPSPFRKPDGSLTAAARRGQRIFDRAEVGCAICHPAPRFTDSSLVTPFVRHDVGTGDGPRERLGPAFDTPSLRGLWDSAPYLHDGSAPSLRDVLTTRNPGDRHGSTSQLTPQEVEDLVAYLKSL